MPAKIAAFLSVLFAALVVGSMFGLWLGLNPAGVSSALWVEEHRQLVRGYNVVVPRMGATAILFTAITAYFARGQAGALILLLVAATCLVLTGLITRFRNQPINETVMTWDVRSVPSGWTQSRDEWWRWHVARVGLGLIALCALIAAAVLR
jgi:hypothetical protein